MKAWDDLKRRLYLACLLLALPAIPIIGVMRWEDEPLVRATYPVLFTALVWLAVGLLTRRVSTRTAELSVLILTPLLWFSRLVAVLYAQPDLRQAGPVVTESVGPGLLILIVVAYLAFDTRRGFWVSGGLAGAYTVVVAPRLLLGAVDAPQVALSLVRAGVFAWVMVGLTYGLAVFKQRAAAQEARTAALAELASTDPLTGIANRREAEVVLDREIDAADRYRRPLTVALVDVDAFKSVNDSGGHAVGDDVLRQVVSLVTTDLRAADLLGRWGGDELVVILPETRLGDAVHTLERARRRIEQDVGTPVTVSAGVASWRPGDTREELVRRADEALYDAKLGGRNQVRATEEFSVSGPDQA